MRLMDLSYPIYENMPVHPYDDSVKLYQNKSLAKDHYTNHQIETSMHAGTHIDAPMHLTKCHQYISDYPLDRFIGPASIIDARDEMIITYKESYQDIVKKGDIVLIYTGHHKKYGTKAYYTDHPVIDGKLAKFFIEQHVKVVGMDLPSPDQYPFNIHKMLMEEGIFIIENLNDFTELISIKRVDIMAFPLKIKAEASMVRVVARLE